ncbi:MAG: polysaccharide biosynthesis protein [Chloroflexota bacterium]
MGDSIKIVDLARDMIELSGLRVGHDIDIEFAGLRPGERLYENLFADNEHPKCTEHEKIFVNHNGGKAAPERFAQQVETLIQVALAGDETATRDLLRQLASAG